MIKYIVLITGLVFVNTHAYAGTYTLKSGGVVAKFTSEYSNRDHAMVEITNSNSYPVTVSVRYDSYCGSRKFTIKKKYKIDEDDFISGKESGVYCTVPNSLFASKRSVGGELLKVKRR